MSFQWSSFLRCVDSMKCRPSFRRNFAVTLCSCTLTKRIQPYREIVLQARGQTQVIGLEKLAQTFPAFWNFFGSSLTTPLWTNSVRGKVGCVLPGAAPSHLKSARLLFYKQTLFYLGKFRQDSKLQRRSWKELKMGGCASWVQFWERYLHVNPSNFILNSACCRPILNVELQNKKMQLELYLFEVDTRNS